LRRWPDKIRVALAALSLTLLLPQAGRASSDGYSTLTQIRPDNLSRLRQAWRHDVPGDALQTTPLVVNGVVYAMTPDQQVIALDGRDGRRLWTFTEGAGGSQPVRGLAAWTNGRQRILYASQGTDLVALDAMTGRPIRGFGTAGRVDLRRGLGRDPRSVATFLSSPAVVWRDLVIVGFRTSETLPAAPGAIRAYDARTGRLRWMFRALPRTQGGGNAWAGMAVDEARGIVYAPTGSAAPDFHGAGRPGDNLYANSLLALDARTGRRLWHFQGVHHDLWDRDFPSPPTLLTVTHEGRRIDAVAQATKQGFLFLFDRVTGRPLFPVEERPVPASTVPGERAWPTQPHVSIPAPFARQHLDETGLTRRTPQAHAAALQQWRTMRGGSLFQPLALNVQTLVFPGFDGGAEWGGSAVDRPRGVLYLNANDIAWTGGLVAAPPLSAPGTGAALYQQHCAACHGVERQGQPPAFPALDDIGSRWLDWQIQRLIVQGKGRMPGFPQLDGAPLQALLAYLRKGPGADREVAGTAATGRDTPRYTFTGYRKFLDIDGYPAVAPPWGTLNAIDLNSGRTLWQVPLGEYPELVAQGHAPTGTENYGGPLVTASGLVFIGASVYDRQLRAFDAAGGVELWRTTLPYAGVATPVTYSIAGCQYVLIATSGSRNPKGPQGAAYVAYALDSSPPTPRDP
jgi:quinoprotein glucose dehydrogenase